MEDEKWQFSFDDNPGIDEKRQQLHKNYKGFSACPGRESFIFVYKMGRGLFDVVQIIDNLSDNREKLFGFIASF